MSHARGVSRLAPCLQRRDSMLLDVDVSRRPDAAILRCRGRLVLGDGAAPLREAGRRALLAGRSLALDLRRVTQIDAHGAGVLAELCAAARETGRALRLIGASDRVRLLLHVTRLDKVIAATADAPAPRLTASA